MTTNTSTKASACALSPGKVAMFFQKGDECQPVLVMTTAEAMSLADEIVSAANVAKAPKQPTETDAAMTADKVAFQGYQRQSGGTNGGTV